MDFHLLLANLTNPTLLFFLLGICAVWVKSDLEIPPSSSKFISLYLLFAIGFKGGQELAHSHFSAEIIYSLLFGIALAALIPAYVFFILRRRMSISDAGAVAAAYGSVSAVTFVAAAGFLEASQISFAGYMVAVMALMESPAIIVGVMLMMRYEVEETEVKAIEVAETEVEATRVKETEVEATAREAIQENPANERRSLSEILHHSFTNGSVLLILGSLIIGLIADTKQAEGIKPFTTDIFKGFLAIFLLDMGMVTARRFAAFRKYGRFVTLFGMLIPLLNGSVVAVMSRFVTAQTGNRFIFAILAASASYIAVPAAMRLAAPKSDPGLYVPMALGVTFPFNITIGMPIYFALVQAT